MSRSLSLDEFLAQRAKDRRLARLTHDVVLPVATGLEFGAAENPLALPDGITVEYVDYAKDACSDRPGAVAVDYAWTGSGSLQAVVGRSGYDFAIAAQVAQYVPNLLGWFRGIYEVLRPGGVLNLSLPDRRFMFDLKRHPSTLGEGVEALLLDLDRPSPRQIFDHTYGTVALDPTRVWREDTDPAALPPLSGGHALALAHKHARETFSAEGRYVTCHCWVFTPFSFLDLIEGASRLGLFPFVVSQFSATEPGSFEFYVCVRRDAEEDPETLLRMQLGAIAYVRDIARQHQRVARRLASD